MNTDARGDRTVKMAIGAMVLAVVMAIALMAPGHAAATTYAFEPNQVENGSMPSDSYTNPSDAYYYGDGHFTWYFSANSPTATRTMTDADGWLMFPNQAWATYYPTTWTRLNVWAYTPYGATPYWMMEGFDVRNTGSSTIPVTVTSSLAGGPYSQVFDIAPGTHTITLTGHGPLQRNTDAVNISFPETIDLSFNNIQLSPYVEPSEPTVTTTAITDVTSNGATAGGTVTADGGAAVTERGVCWSVSANPTTSDAKTVDGSGTGSFTSWISGLNSSTTYHVRAYATSSAGTSYGDEVTFTTSAPLVSTPASSTWSLASLVAVAFIAIFVLRKQTA